MVARAHLGQRELRRAHIAQDAAIDGVSVIRAGGQRGIGPGGLDKGVRATARERSDGVIKAAEIEDAVGPHGEG